MRLLIYRGGKRLANQRHNLEAIGQTEVEWRDEWASLVLRLRSVIHAITIIVNARKQTTNARSEAGVGDIVKCTLRPAEVSMSGSIL